ncbi:MAG: glycosyltransferase family 2 protein [Lachnospiraceae bacterium]|jgi:glycosyltransferase involved in cell wall biosynthesis|nr:glycosyltransferase family 2 protein [Lachnospiraceae bacterium]
MSDLLIIIPAYNEEANIAQVVERLEQNFPQYDYLVVNDGSKDGTGEILKQRRYHYLELSVNLGLAGGFQAGMKYAWAKGYSYAIQIDGDGQHRPEYIAKMKKKMDEGYDIVIGSRFLGRKKRGSLRMAGSSLIEAAIRLTTGAVIKDPTSGMRLFSRRMIERFSKELNYGPEPDTISYLLRGGAKVAEVAVVMDERTGGESYLTPIRAARYMLHMLMSILFIQNFRKREE